MELNRSQSVTVDKILVICKLHEIVDYYLLGDGTWPLDRESLQAFCKTVRDLGLDEAVAGQPGTTRSTALGKELKLDLIMAFVGAWDMWEILSVLEEHGYIDETEAEALFSVPLFEGERRLKWLVLRTYFEFCDRSQRAN